jgi:acyl-CoA thioesterase-2
VTDGGNAGQPGGAAANGDHPVDRLVGLLDLDDLGGDRFGVRNHDRGFGPRVFGGQVAAQALRAAQRTVPSEGPEAHHVHSIHSSFLLAGRPGEPIVYEVDRLRDGRSFTTRRVEARQGDDRIFTLLASFHKEEAGAEYQLPMADVPPPDEAPDQMLFVPDEERPRLPFEMRELGATDPDDRGWIASTRRAWMRLPQRVPDDPALHQCLLTYLSDMGALFAAWARGSAVFANIAATRRASWDEVRRRAERMEGSAPEPSFEPERELPRLMGASLDHSLWFHRPIRADEWFLYDAHAVSNAGSRGLMRGTLHAADGTLGVSIAQEALLRVG